MIKYIKNVIVSNEYFYKAIIFFINLPVFGNLYDWIYFKRIRNRMENDDLEITIEGHNICNLRCIMCPYKRMKRKKQLMSMELFKKIVNEASELGCKSISPQQQSEPFIDKFIFERIDYIKKVNPEIKINLYSNALVLNKKIRKKILDNPPNMITFSVDGATKKTYESIRVNSNFEVVVNNIESLIKERKDRDQKLPKIKVSFTLMKENKKEGKQFLKYWKNKADESSLYPVDSRESGNFPLVKYKKKKQYPCFNPNFLNILSNGDVTLCCVDVDGTVTIGNLNKQSLEEIWKSEKSKQFTQSHLLRKNNLKICNNCSKLYVDSAFIWWS